MQFILCYSIQEVNEILAFWDFLEFLYDILGIAIYNHFGISKILASKSKALTVVGTPSYISPELCEGKEFSHKYFSA